MKDSNSLIREIVSHLKHLHPGALRRVLLMVERERHKQMEQL